ncbi:MAG: hypothetical protein ACFFAO_10565 [Candidatus Hermodarchaeota archaeon]
MKKYYCSKCVRFHYRGKIYKEHIKYKSGKKHVPKTYNKAGKDFPPSDKFIEFDYNKLRPIARRQIQRLINKMYKTRNFRLYTKEINRTIIYEKEKMIKSEN